MAAFLAVLAFAPARGGAAAEDGAAGQPAATPAAQGRKIVVTAARAPRELNDVAAAVDLVEGSQIRERYLARSLPEALREVPGVLLQQTARGQASPYLRGFTGFRTLLLIDGIRLNNAVFRDGPNQYWGTIDPLTIERLEIVRGPGSVLYGSDAVGGTVNVLTRGCPAAGDGEGTPLRRRLWYRFASADESHTGRAELAGTVGRQVGFLGGGSYRNFDDLEGGRHVGLQPQTGYEEADGDLKVEMLAAPDVRLVFAHQNVNQDNAWRTHATIHGLTWRGTRAGSDLKRVLDQHRDLTYLQVHREAEGAAALRGSLSWHDQEEEQWRVREDGRAERQEFRDGTLGAWTVLEGPANGAHRLTGGLEYYRDFVDSATRRWDADGSFAGRGIQGPVADEATYDLLGGFLQDELALQERLTLVLGGRGTWAHAAADRVEDPVSGGRTTLDESWGDFTGSARLLARLDDQERCVLFGGVGQAFRAPNLSDLTRLDSARSGEIETPSPGLDPEHFVTTEAGMRVASGDWRAELAYYYTFIRDLIVRAPTGRTIDGEAEVTKLNAAEGYVHGVELGGSSARLAGFSVFGGLGWQDGEVEGYPGSSTAKETEPLSRLLPLSGHAGLRFELPQPEIWVETVLTAAARQDNLPAADVRDNQRIPPGGTPGYGVLGLRAGWRVNRNLTLTAALENVADRDYRVHGSGLNEPGLNGVVGLFLEF